MNKAFTLSFVPTITNTEIKIQVDKVEMKYYAFQQGEEIINPETNEKRYFYELSKNPTLLKVYTYFVYLNIGT